MHFILDAVAQLPITDFRVNERGSGSEQYNFTDPETGIMVCVSYNLKRLFTLKNLAVAAQNRTPHLSRRLNNRVGVVKIRSQLDSCPVSAPTTPFFRSHALHCTSPSQMAPAI